MVVIDGWLMGQPERIYNMISQDDENPKGRWNTMRMMREAFGLPLGSDGIEEWLHYWDSLDPEQRQQLRRMDLDELKKSNIPAPPQRMEK